MTEKVRDRARKLERQLHNLRARNASLEDQVEAIETALRSNANFQQKALADLLTEVYFQLGWDYRDRLSKDRTEKIRSMVGKALNLLVDV